MGTKIEWTSETWNPVIGCTKISSGCSKCYAERFSYRLRMMANKTDSNNVFDKYVNVVDFKGNWKGKTEFVESALEKPFRWKKPRMIFVCSMGDLFHESVPFEWIDKVLMIINMNPKHTFQILTKRPERMLEYYKYLQNDRLVARDFIQFKDNVWLGVTCENQEMADKRIPILLQTPAKVRFVSCEPLLNDIWIPASTISLLSTGGRASNGSYSPGVYVEKINWVIAGPETGPGARPMKREWIASLYEQCEAANVPFFDKKNVLGLNIQQYPITH